MAAAEGEEWEGAREVRRSEESTTGGDEAVPLIPARQQGVVVGGAVSDSQDSLSLAKNKSIDCFCFLSFSVLEFFEKF